MALWILSHGDFDWKHCRRGVKRMVVSSLTRYSAEGQRDECGGVSPIGYDRQSAGWIGIGQERRGGARDGEPRWKQEAVSLSR